jgi:hypothetical protein
MARKVSHDVTARRGAPQADDRLWPAGRSLVLASSEVWPCPGDTITLSGRQARENACRAVLGGWRLLGDRRLGRADQDAPILRGQAAGKRIGRRRAGSPGAGLGIYAVLVASACALNVPGRTVR